MDGEAEPITVPAPVDPVTARLPRCQHAAYRCPMNAAIGRPYCELHQLPEPKR